MTTATGLTPAIRQEYLGKVMSGIGSILSIGAKLPIFIFRDLLVKNCSGSYLMATTTALPIGGGGGLDTARENAVMGMAEETISDTRLIGIPAHSTLVLRHPHFDWSAQ